MIFYLFLPFIVCGIVYIVEKDKYKIFPFLTKMNKTKLINFMLILSCFICIAVLTLRNPKVADDTYNYYTFFENPYPSFAEYGFFLLAKFVRMFTSNFHIFLLVTSSISIIPFYYLVYKINNNKWVYLFLYHVFLIYIYNFAIIRQSIAMSIVFLGIFYFNQSEKTLNQRRFIFLGYILLAFLFHRISVILIPILFVDNILLNKKRIIYFIVITFILFFLKDKLLFILFNFFLPDKLIYLESQTGISSFGIIPFTVFLSVALLYIYQHNWKFEIENIYVKVNYYFIFIALFLYWFPAYGRILQFGYLNIVFLLGNCLNFENFKKKYVKKFCFVICILFYVYLLLQNPYHVIPYYM